MGYAISYVLAIITTIMVMFIFHIVGYIILYNKSRNYKIKKSTVVTKKSKPVPKRDSSIMYLDRIPTKYSPIQCINKTILRSGTLKFNVLKGDNTLSVYLGKILVSLSTIHKGKPHVTVSAGKEPLKSQKNNKHEYIGSLKGLYEIVYSFDDGLIRITHKIGKKDYSALWVSKKLKQDGRDFKTCIKGYDDNFEIDKIDVFTTPPTSTRMSIDFPSVTGETPKPVKTAKSTPKPVKTAKSTPKPVKTAKSTPKPSKLGYMYIDRVSGKFSKLRYFDGVKLSRIGECSFNILKGKSKLHIKIGKVNPITVELGRKDKDGDVSYVKLKDDKGWISNVLGKDTTYLGKFIGFYNINYNFEDGSLVILNHKKIAIWGSPRLKRAKRENYEDIGISGYDGTYEISDMKSKETIKKK